MATPSQVDGLLDDSAMARADAQEAFRRQEHLGRMLIALGERLVRHASAGVGALDDQDRALRAIRDLRPTARGRRTDLLGEAA